MFFAGVAITVYFSHKAKAPEQQYYYPTPEPKGGAMYNHETVKGG